MLLVVGTLFDRAFAGHFPDLLYHPKRSFSRTCAGWVSESVWLLYFLLITGPINHWPGVFDNLLYNIFRILGPVLLLPSAKTKKKAYRNVFRNLRTPRVSLTSSNVKKIGQYPNPDISSDKTWPRRAQSPASSVPLHCIRIKAWQCLYLSSPLAAKSSFRL